MRKSVSNPKVPLRVPAGPGAAGNKRGSTSAAVTVTLTGVKKGTPATAVAAVIPGKENNCHKGKRALNLDVEVICLDSQPPIVPGPAKMDKKKVVMKPDGNGKQKESASVSRVLSIQKDPSTPPPAPPKMNIEEYYKSRGLSYAVIRQQSRQYVRSDGRGGGRLYWDTFSPPPGYKIEDLPPPPESPIPRLFDGEDKTTVSPTVLVAKKYKKSAKTKPVNCFPSVEEEVAEMEFFLNKFKSIGTKRRASTDSGEIHKTARKKSPVMASTPVSATVTPGGRDESKTSHNSFNSSFPDGDDYLNDSALLRCSQAVEMQLEEEKSKSKPAEKPFSIAELVEKNNQVNQKPDNQRISSLSRKGKYRVLNTSATSAMETPTTDSNNSTPRRSSRLNSRPGTAESSSSTTSISKVFENSLKMSDATSQRQTRANTTLPRKSLFNVPAANRSESPVTMGVFEDDSEDELFSQIEIPSNDSENINLVNSSANKAGSRKTDKLGNGHVFQCNSDSAAIVEFDDFHNLATQVIKDCHNCDASMDSSYSFFEKST